MNEYYMGKWLRSGCNWLYCHSFMTVYMTVRGGVGPDEEDLLDSCGYFGMFLHTG